LHATIQAERDAAHAELREITLALNDERTHNTMTPAEVCRALKADVARLTKIIEDAKCPHFCTPPCPFDRWKSAAKGGKG
jgi:hypothetical protein